MHYNQYIYGRERRRFGRQCLFVSRHFLLVSIFPNPKQRSEFIMANPLNQATQLSKQMALSTMLTQNVQRIDRGVDHIEGGWPREVSAMDEEQTMRHRKKIEREDHWTKQVNRLVNRMIKLCVQNAVVSIYEDFFVDSFDSDDEVWAPYEAFKYHVYEDPVRNPKRIVSNIEFSLTEEDRMLIVYTPRRPEVSVGRENLGGDEKRFCVFNWNIENPMKPISSYDNNTYIYILLHCPKDANMLAGGDFAGRVSLWDNRKLGLPGNTCLLESAHREAVSALCWVHSKTNTEFYSGSLDGSVKFWDARELYEPFVEVLLDPELTDEQVRSRAHGVTVLEFEYTIPVRFIVASEHGHVFIGNRKGGFPTEILLNNFKLFSGPVRSVERNPFFVKNFLLCGDFCCKIWSEESKNCPSSFVFRNKAAIFCGTWSPVRCSLFVTGDAQGGLLFWDILLDQRQPVFSIQLHAPITTLKFSPEGYILAAGMENGHTQILELDEVMFNCTTRERALTSSHFEREQSRCKLLEGRVEEFKLRNKNSISNMMSQEHLVPKIDISTLNPQNPEQFLQIIDLDEDFKRALIHFQNMNQRVLKKRSDRDHLMERTDFDLYT